MYYVEYLQGDVKILFMISYDDTGSPKKRIALLERRNTILQREVLDLKKQLV